MRLHEKTPGGGVAGGLESNTLQAVDNHNCSGTHCRVCARWWARLRARTAGCTCATDVVVASDGHRVTVTASHSPGCRLTAQGVAA